MADIRKALDILGYLEHNSDETKVLHKNEFEDGCTFFGIYQKAHPNWKGWAEVKSVLNVQPDLKKAGIKLMQSQSLKDLVVKFYKEEFWNKARLDEVISQEIAQEIFIFMVNVGPAVAIKRAQRLAGCTEDGSVGPMTIKALNALNEKEFDFAFDDLEKEYYNSLIKNKPYLGINKNGWYKRADYV